VRDANAAGFGRADVIGWALRILLAGVFLYQGIDKFGERRLWLQVFQEIGFGQWFRYFTGIVEVAGAMMLLIPRATLLGVVVLVCVLTGALLTHVLVIGVGPQSVFVMVLLAMLIGLGARFVKRRNVLCEASSATS
jgi:uncharacterized membrane protein YphA (DoxX/SURF4 family)